MIHNITRGVFFSIQVVKNGALDNVDETADFDDLIDIETLLGEDNFMPTAI